MTIVMCLHSSMQGENILDDAKMICVDFSQLVDHCGT